MAYVAEEVDHISQLPDAIIHRVFSFLPFKDVVKTSVLSKQWRFAWTSTPFIDLSPPSAVVVRDISGALRLCTAAKIEKFHLDATKYVLIDPYLGIHFAVERKVEDASFAFQRYVCRCLCHCASLVSLQLLQLSKCRFLRDFTIHWPSLKKLCLHDLTLEKDQIVKFLSGCPVLESLTLHHCFSRHTCDLRIDSRSLRELVIESVYGESVDVSAPNLLSLRLSGGFVHVGFRLHGASSLAEAELNFAKPSGLRGYIPERLKLLLEQLQHVAKITMGSWCLEVLSAVEVMGMSYLPMRWRNIIVYTAFSKSNHLGMAYLLQSSPLLERLVICNPKSDNITFDNKDYPELCDFDEKQFWHSQKEFYCVANHLKRVEIVGFEFDSEKSKPLLALAKFFLEKAVGLEKMIIDVELRMSRRGVPMDPHDLRGIQVVIQLQEGCRRASRNAEVIVNHFNGLPTKA